MADYDLSGMTARLQRVGIRTIPDAPAISRGLTRLIENLRTHPWFSAIVVLPSALAVLYFGLIASDQYVSEARYIVRSVNNTHMSVLGNLLQTAGLSAAQDDAYSVHDYILSRDIVRKLSARHDLKGVLSRPEGDFLTRFPPLIGGDSFEQLYWVYGNFVEVTVDDTSGISTLEVHAYRPEDARNIANAILAYSEDLVNQMNARSRHDAVAVAQREVDAAEQRVEQTETALTAYRVHNRVLDPVKQSGAVLELAAKLSADLAASQAQLSELERSAPNSPLIEPLKRHIAAVGGQIGVENNKVVGDNNGAVLTLSQYEQLMLAREFAGKNLASALASLESARLDAQRKQIYIDRIVQPNLPDYAVYPRRLISILEVVISALLIYGIGWLVSASVREHVGR